MYNGSLFSISFKDLSLALLLIANLADVRYTMSWWFDLHFPDDG